MKRKILWILPLLVIGLLLAACGGSTTSYQQKEAQITQDYAKKLDQAVPYPLAQMNYSAERANLRERLLRENDPNKIGYVYVFPPYGSKPIGYYTIRGKVSSTSSQMTVSQQAVGCYNGCSAVVESMGDDGSYGPNEGGQNGIFFFTTGGVWIETTMPWIYTDAPLPLSVPSLNPSSAPTSMSHYWCQVHPHTPHCP